MNAPAFSGAAQRFLDQADADIVAGRVKTPITGPFWPSEAWGNETPEPRRFMVDGWLAVGSGALLAGEGGTGKSLLGQMLCTCVAMGLPFLGYQTECAPAAYITAEDDVNELHLRQLAINAALGIEMGDVGEFLTLYSLKGDPACELALFNEAGSMEPSELFSEIAMLGARLTVLDNSAHMFPGDENNRRHVAAFCSLLDRLAMRTKGVALLLAHTPKTGAEFSGSTGWDAHVRQRLYLRHDNEAGDPDLRVLSRSKSNYARRGETVQFRWHKGAFVLPSQLGDIAGEIAAVAAGNRDDELFLACLDQRNRECRPVSERPCLTYAPKVFATMPESKGIGKPRLQSAMDRLFRAQQIERGFVYRDTAEGKDKTGIRRPANPPANRPLTASADDRPPLTPTSADDRSHSPIPTVLRDVPSPQREGHVPFRDDDEDPPVAAILRGGR